MSIKNKRYCDYSCTCIRSECRLNHFIKSFGFRKTAKQFYDDNFDALRHTEIIGITNKSCVKGLFCLEPSCKRKHGCNLTFRNEMFDLWKNFERNVEILAKVEEESIVI